MNQEIPFSEVRPGEKFTSRKTKRAFVGVKIQLYLITSLDGDCSRVNAVMTYYDHMSELGPESGALILVDDEEIVEVER